MQWDHKINYKISGCLNIYQRDIKHFWKLAINDLNLLNFYGSYLFRSIKIFIKYEFNFIIFFIQENWFDKNI